MHHEWINLDFSAYARLASRKVLVAVLRRAGILSETRCERLKGVDPEIIAWDLRKGIPFPDHSLELIYHSHFLEHLPHEVVHGFLVECRRALKPGASIRIAVPDLGYLARTLIASEQDPDVHEQVLEELFEQMVRSEAAGKREQSRLVGWLEERIRGDARSIGELHCWMYDETALARALRASGFVKITRQNFDRSVIPNWSRFLLDCNPDGTEYKPHTLYMEAENPG
jgi:SAM-dependent methyltransferase